VKRPGCSPTLLPQTSLLQQLAWADGRWPAISRPKVAEKKGNVILPGNPAEGRQVYFGWTVWIAGMPAGKAAIVVGCIGSIPAKDNIAKTQTTIIYIQELSAAMYFPRKTPSISVKANFTFPEGWSFMYCSISFLS
jgi:hypothetical protein